MTFHGEGMNFLWNYTFNSCNEYVFSDSDFLGDEDFNKDISVAWE